MSKRRWKIRRLVRRLWPRAIVALGLAFTAAWMCFLVYGLAEQRVQLLVYSLQVRLSEELHGCRFKFALSDSASQAGQTD
jgi:hypothetical protein